MLWKFNIRFMTLLVIILTSASLMQSQMDQGYLMDNIQISTNIDSDWIALFVPVSHRTCRYECMARKVCQSYNYLTQSHVCELQSNTKSESLIHMVGSVYSEKRTWNLQTLSPLCDECDDRSACDISTSLNVTCLVKECYNVPEIPNTKRFGNVKQVGATLKFECESESTRTNGTSESICQPDGNWTIPSIGCHRADTPCSKPDVYGVTSSVSSQVLTQDGMQNTAFTCPSNTIARGSPILCNITTGQFNPGCCDDQLDSEWIRIFRILTAKQVNVLGLWETATSTGSDSTRSECQFRRSDIIDNWEGSINQVKVEIFKDGLVHSWVIFNGTGSGKYGWFSLNRILNTSWTDLKSSSATVSLKGQYKKARLYRFLMVEQFAKQCQYDVGWLMVGSRGECVANSGYTKNDYPIILFSEKNTKSKKGSEFSVADKLEVSIKIA